MLAEVLRRLLVGPSHPLQGRIDESRLGDLEARVSEVEERLAELERQEKDLEARFGEWMGAKGYS